MTIKESVPLAPFTTFRTGGEALFFVEVSSHIEVQEAVAFAKEKQVPFFVLGGGSNIVMSDEGFPGLVIKNTIKSITFGEEKDGVCEVVSGAGEIWDELVAETVKRGFSGLENLSLIPGTVGAAPVQNIGAYGVEAKDTISWVEVYDPTAQEVKKFSNAECEFEYRFSIFKKPEYKHLIILRVAFVLSKNKKPNSSYKDVALYFSEYGISEPSIMQVRDAVVFIRTKKLPSVKEFGTAGSFFKNPVISKEHFATLQTRYPGIPSFPAGENVKVPLGWILDNVCNVKGMQIGNVGTYKNQALVIINVSNATSKEIKTFADTLIALVKEKTDITIFPEVEYVGIIV